jgi:hypothetical protein
MGTEESFFCSGAGFVSSGGGSLGCVDSGGFGGVFGIFRPDCAPAVEAVMIKRLRPIIIGRTLKPNLFARMFLPPFSTER